MKSTMHAGQGPHFLQIPGPSNVPKRVLQALSEPTIDHRSQQFADLAIDCITATKKVFQSEQDLVIYPGSGTGAWEAALVNLCDPGDRLLMAETGHFASLWWDLAERLGYKAELIKTDWRRGAPAEELAKSLEADKEHAIKAVCVVHNETSTGSVSNISAVRRVLDELGHPALLLVDTISSLGSIDYRHDAWGVDVTISGSQKGLMLPPGLSFNMISPKALAACQERKRPVSYWDWQAQLKMSQDGFFPYTPATNMLYALREAVDMLLEEGLENVFSRHKRHGEATRRAVRAWGLETQCQTEEYSSSLTAVRVPEGASADKVREVVLRDFNMSLGNGLARLKDQVFRIGHLGDFNDLMLMGVLSGVEMGLKRADIGTQSGGCDAAMAYLNEAAVGSS
ncbi:MAG: aminotransferase class V-fold PLP-dependent enzyme [Alphaproteobacteria bacterium]|nr:aminotransferase class V-fold PLP-dependent enzyme [Alphaproteobacteria bacterium]